MSARVAVVTGSRSEYGLFHPLLVEFRDSGVCEPRLIVTGAHLDERYGLTVREIEEDGFSITARVPIPLDDSGLGVARATGLAVMGIADALAEDSPDLVLILGDRYEALAAATAAMLLRIPIAHLHGGELTEGAIDDSIRHAITKMASLHFVSTEEYRRRVIRMGEDPARVFAVGALGVDNALATQLLDRKAVSEATGLMFERPTALVTFHPMTHAADSGTAQVDALLGALDDHPGIDVLFTLPNADEGNLAIRERIESWAARNFGRANAHPSLGRVRYLSALALCDVVVGNSSSGIIEAPSFGKPVVDIGDRQAGRVRAASVRHCDADREQIAAAIANALTPEARTDAARVSNPYGDGHAAPRISDAVRDALASGISSRKRFYDIDCTSSEGKRD